MLRKEISAVEIAKYENSETLKRDGDFAEAKCTVLVEQLLDDGLDPLSVFWAVYRTALVASVRHDLQVHMDLTMLMGSSIAEQIPIAERAVDQVNNGTKTQ